MEGLLRAGPIALFLCILTVPSLAVDPVRPLEQLRVANWNQQNGLLQDTTNALAQTPDGFLWVASDESLVRFDGIEFFVPGEFQEKPLLQRMARSLWTDSGGQLWIGSYGRVYCRVRKGVFQPFDTTAGVPRSEILAIATDGQGTVWAGTYQAGLYWKNGDRFAEYTPAQEMRQQRINCIRPGQSGDLWVATSDGLYRINKSKGSVQKIKAGGDLPDKPVTAIALDLAGRVWVAADERLAYVDSDTLYPVELRSGDKSGITALFTDSHGRIWIGSRKGGVWRMLPDPKIAEAEFRSLVSLVDVRRNSLISGFCEDLEGNIWIGSDAGLFRISDTRFTVLNAKQGLPSDLVNSVLSSRSGKVWVGTDAGLAFLDGSASTHATSAPPVSPVLSEQVTTLYEDAQNLLWVGTVSGAVQAFRQEPFSAVGEPSRFSPVSQINAICGVPPDDVWVGTNGSGLHRFHNGKLIQSLTEQDGIVANIVHALAVGPDNTLWVAGGRGLMKYKDGRLEEVIPNDNPLHDFAIISLVVDAEGTLWAGTYGFGLARIKNGVVSRLCNTSNGLLSDEFFTLIQDDKGFFWASSNRGIFAIKKRELNEFFDQNRWKVTCRRFTAADGLLTAECNGGNTSTSCRTNDGRLWFATIDGIAITSRDTLTVDSRSPPVVLERMMANLTQYIAMRPGDRVSLSPNIHSIEIHYAGMSLLAPESLQYRYRLKGFDDNWVDAGTRRVAFYTNLPPGKYEFEVVVCNRDGIWTPERLATRADIFLQPHFYQTWWFDALCVCLAILLIWLLYRWRLQQILQERARLARDLHDTLAQGLVGILWQTESAIRSERKKPGAVTIETLERISTLTRETLMEARGALKALRAGILAESDSLVNALQGVVNKGTSGTSLKSSVSVRGEPFRLRSQWEEALVRITQEALTNTLKYANADRFEVELHFEDKGLTVLLQDDGVGFTVPCQNPKNISATSSGLGILGMKERCRQLGGELTIRSSAGKGTLIQVTVPASAKRSRWLWQKPWPF